MFYKETTFVIGTAEFIIQSLPFQKMLFNGAYSVSDMKLCLFISQFVQQKILNVLKGCRTV